VSAAMSVAATRRLDVRRQDTSATLGILSCARSRRARDGLGAMSMKFMAASRKKVRHSKENLWQLKSMT
jgi:hypothetical protein